MAKPGQGSLVCLSIAGGEGIPEGGCGGRGRIDLGLYRRGSGDLHGCGAGIGGSDLADYLENAKAAVLYTVAYLYEHREEADHRGLMLTLRALLFGVRREGF